MSAIYTLERRADNPPAGSFHNLSDDGHRYKVKNTTMLGPHKDGSVIGAIHLGPGAQVQRLIDANVLEPLSDHEKSVLKSQGHPAMQPIPKPDPLRLMPEAIQARNLATVFDNLSRLHQAEDEAASRQSVNVEKVQPSGRPAK